MRFRERRDLRQHRDRFLGILAHGRFGGEHDAISAVENGVRHISRFRARGQTAVGHRLEHLRRGDDWLAGQVRFCDQLLLQGGDRFDRHFHAEIAARDHDAVTRGENLVVMLERIGALDLRDDEWMMTELFRGAANGIHVGRALDE